MTLSNDDVLAKFHEWIDNNYSVCGIIKYDEQGSFFREYKASDVLINTDPKTWEDLYDKWVKENIDV